MTGEGCNGGGHDGFSAEYNRSPLAPGFYTRAHATAHNPHINRREPTPPRPSVHDMNTHLNVIRLDVALTRIVNSHAWKYFIHETWYTPLTCVCVCVFM